MDLLFATNEDTEYNIGWLMYADFEPTEYRFETNFKHQKLKIEL